MKLNPKLTGGLAWGGLIVILAVPSADLLTKPQSGAAAVITSDTDQVRTASVAAPAAQKPPVAVTVPTTPDPVDAYLASGKKLPSYISDAPAGQAGLEPAPTVQLELPSQPTPTQAPPVVEVASIGPAPVLVAPEPYPASKRPRPPATVTTAAVERAPAVVGEQPLILDEALVARREAAVARVLDEQPAAFDRIEGDRLEEWDSGSLAEYLERRGLLSGSQAQAQASDVDEDGFFLDQGPNNDDGRRVIRRLPRGDFFLF